MRSTSTEAWLTSRRRVKPSSKPEPALTLRGTRKAIADAEKWFAHFGGDESLLSLTGRKIVGKALLAARMLLDGS